MKIEQLENLLKEMDEYFQIKVIGKSVLGKNIYSINKEFDPEYKWVLVTGGIHAREHLSTDLICKLIELGKDKKLKYNISFVPLVNPDGVMLCIDGINSLSSQLQEKLISLNGSKDFSLYKANINGVDLNNNWQANWENKFTDKVAPASQGYYGIESMSEPEVKSLADWALSLDLFLTLSYHLKGEEIYFDFFQDDISYKRDKKVAEVFSKSTHYKIKSTQACSSGGFKDWCVMTLKVPSLTIELGDDKFTHPYPQSELTNIFNKNKNFFNDVEKALKIYQNYM